MSTTKNLVSILTDADFIEKAKVDKALAHCDDTGISLFDSLIDQNVIEEEQLLTHLSKELDIPFEKIDRTTIDFRVASIIPEAFARDNFVLPLFQLGNILTIAITNPFDFHTIEEVEMITGLDVSPILSLKESLSSLYEFTYSYQDTKEPEDPTTMSSLFEMGMKIMEERSGEGDDEMVDLAQEAPIAKLVDTIIKQAISEKASDIHIEPEETLLKVRFRIDGILKDVMNPPKSLESAIISRLKILSNLDITETRKPQDGRITVNIKDRDIDFRVSTVRTISGEKMVLRVLDKSGAFVSLERIGLTENDFQMLTAMISSASGILIVCGPTGSGKTSSLYSCLSKINSPEKNIITIEDPVEFNLAGINQIPVNTKIGVDFVTGLSAIVRQDPDIIMIGEIRDIKTADIAIQAALTGHMVFSTLHTRDAAGTITRLINMGVQPFLITSSVVGIIGQRLVRTICPNCKKTTDASIYTGYKKTQLVKSLEEMVEGKLKLHIGEGCKFCDETGYKGRTGIFEVMGLNEEVRALILQKSSTEIIQKAASKAGMTTMKHDGLQKILSGITTVDEIARVIDL
ncbi:Flp pilus assembly complex ATPase component TadA [bacterium]|nr:Flp pilus assembly complex ATPase component TadA [bacterium]